MRAKAKAHILEMVPSNSTKGRSKWCQMLGKTGISAYATTQDGPLTLCLTSHGNHQHHGHWLARKHAKTFFKRPVLWKKVRWYWEGKVVTYCWREKV